MNYELLSYAELRVIAKSLNIPANIKKDLMIKQIQDSSSKFEEENETPRIETKLLVDNVIYNNETLSSMVLAELRVIGDKYNISHKLKKSLMIDAIIAALEKNNEKEENFLQVDVEIPIVKEDILDVEVEIDNVIVEEKDEEVKIEKEIILEDINIENELIIATSEIVLDSEKNQDELRIEKEDLVIIEHLNIENENKNIIETLIDAKNLTPKKKSTKTKKCLLSSFTACATEDEEENNNPNIIATKIDKNISNKKTIFTSPSSKTPLNIQNSENVEIVCLNSITSTSTKWNYEDFDKSPKRPANLLRGIASPKGKKIEFTSGLSPVPNQIKNSASKWGYEDFSM